MSDRHVSSVKDYRRQRPIRILKDTGASQSLLLRRYLPGRAKTTTGRRINIRGVGSQIVNMGIVSKLPVNEVEMLLENDLAGRKVMTSSPTKSRKPVRNKKSNKKLRKTNAVSGRITRTQAKLINRWKEGENTDLF